MNKDVQHFFALIQEGYDKAEDFAETVHDDGLRDLMGVFIAATSEANVKVSLIMQLAALSSEAGGSDGLN